MFCLIYNFIILCSILNGNFKDFKVQLFIAGVKKMHKPFWTGIGFC